MPNKRPVRRNLLIALGTTLLGTAAMVGIQTDRAHTARERVRTVLESHDTFGTIHKLSLSSKAADRRRAADLRRDCDAWFAEVLARNPGLEPEWRAVADEENGFLQLLAFAEAKRIDGEIGNEQLGLPEELLAILSGSDDWNHDSAATALADQQDLINEITRIGLLPGQSAAGVSIDRFSFIGARLYKQCCDLLLADARLAAELGDADRSLQRVRASLGIARHLSNIEVPSLLMETVSVLVRLGVDAQVVQHILPTLDLDPDALTAWRHVVAGEHHEPAGFARLLRGEAYVSIRGLAIPLLVENRSELSDREIPDPDAFLDAVADCLLDRASRVKGTTLGQLSISMTPEPIVAPAHLSPGAQEAYDMFYIGARAWSRGWTRAASIHARTEAAFAILTDTEPPPEPITGLPFVFDPETRTLAHPDDPRLDMVSADPIKLP